MDISLSSLYRERIGEGEGMGRERGEKERREDNEEFLKWNRRNKEEFLPSNH